MAAIAKKKAVVMTAKQLMTQGSEELEQVNLDRNLEDARVALTRAIEDKEKELRDHQAAEGDRVKQFVTEQNPNILTDDGKELTIKEDLETLKAVLKSRFPA